MTSSSELREQFGNIDIYLFDQLLKGRFNTDMRLLDAGCGDGRNLIYFMREGYSCFAVDGSAQAIGHVRRMASVLAPRLPHENFRVETIESMSFADESFDAVICSAVLHFAANEDDFRRMLEEMWRVLLRGGIFFARLASSIGIENKITARGDGRYLLPDGSERFLVDEEMLLALTNKLGAEFLEPIKTTNVQNMRAMTTWCIRRS
ncbi:MAG: class I SAM-dependent methyltransferase [Pyrinomonadaceae bacterium]